MSSIENVILSQLISNEQYLRNVSPHLKSEYFEDKLERKIHEIIMDFFSKYNKSPTKRIIELSVREQKSLNQTDYDNIVSIIHGLDDESNEDYEWLINSTEKFCKDRSIYLALVKAINIAEGNDKELKPDAIPDILSKALAVSFDTTVGHDYFENHDSRYDYYHAVENRIPFSLDILNQVTNGGMPKKTLNLFVAGTGVGKSLTMCDHSAYLIKKGYKVLYVTMEMAEERIAERIDCNLFDIEIKNLFKMDKDSYNSKISDLKERYKGNLVIKEYPTGQANVGHFRILLDELKLKRNFMPDVIFIDYLSICSSQRLKGGGNVNSYTYIKAISEELRGLAVEYDVALVSAVQFNRDGNKNSDSELTDISESFGIAMTADYMIGMIRTEELDELKQIMFKQLKSRYGDVNYYKRFVVGVELSKFKLHDVEGFSNDTPMFDKSQQIKQDRADIDFDG